MKRKGYAGDADDPDEPDESSESSGELPDPPRKKAATGQGPELVPVPPVVVTPVQEEDSPPPEDDQGSDDQGGEPAVLTDEQIAALSLDELRAAWDVRDQGFGIRTDDIGAIEFRRDALDALLPPNWIMSPSCANLILPWLTTRAGLVQDLIDLVTTRRAALTAPAIDAVSVAERGQVRDAVLAGAQVSAQARDEGCEYLAHAVCEVIAERFAGIARLRLAKIWLIASTPRLHPPQNWNHHVAPILDCADGSYVIDPYLAPDGPVTRDAWLTLARGTAAQQGLVNHTRPWELMGCPTINAAGFELATYIPRADAAAQIQACKRAVTT